MRFGRYVLLDKLATGGMAELFLAKSLGEAGFERVCVIKRVLPHLASHPDFVAMFLDEGRLAARLHHPNIVQIFDLGREASHYYLAMEYLPGEDLSAVLRQGSVEGRQVPVDVALALVARAAEALHWVHTLTDDDGRALGAVHRDVSPSNLMVTYAGQVKVLDFGIAQAGAGMPVAGVRGKLGYLAPEQLLGDAVDARADVWALGVCLYELLTGASLRPRLSLSETVKHMQTTEVPSLRARRPDAPPGCEALVMQALAPDPRARLPNALALQLGLEEILRAHTGSVHGPPLGPFLAEWFGPDRASRKQRPLMLSPTVEPVQGTAPFLESIAEFEAKTRAHNAPGMPVMTVPVREAMAPPAARARRLFVSLAAATATLGAVCFLVLRGGVTPFLSHPMLPEPVPFNEPTPRTNLAPALALEPTSTPRLAPAVQVPRVALPHPRPPASRPERAQLEVESSLPVDVFEDGRLLGKTPLRVMLPAGPHVLRFTSPGLGLLRSEHMTLKPGEHREQRLDFAKGRLDVDAVPWADVYLDGKRLGATPLQSLSVWEGTHVLRLVAPQGEKTLDVQVTPGSTTRVHERVP